MQDFAEPTETAAGLRESIRKILATIARIDPAELDDEVRIREELGVDSLMAMEIIATCEQRLEVSIDENDVVEIETVGEFIDFLIGITRERHVG